MNSRVLQNTIVLHESIYYNENSSVV